MAIERSIKPDLLIGFEPKRKVLLSVRQILLFIGLTIATMFLHMYIILSPLPINEQDKMAFLAGFTIFLAVPFVSLALSVILAFIPIKEYPYPQRFMLFLLFSLLLIEMALVIITLAGR